MKNVNLSVRDLVLSFVMVGTLAFGAGGVTMWLAEVKPRNDAEWWSNKRTNEYTQNGTLGSMGAHLKQQGWSNKYGSYHNVSFDKGVTWWSLKDNGAIVERADDNVVRHSQGINAMIEYAKENGPISGDSMTEEQVKVLGEAGLSVK